MPPAQHHTLLGRLVGLLSPAEPDDKPWARQHQYAGAGAGITRRSTAPVEEEEEDEDVVEEQQRREEGGAGSPAEEQQQQAKKGPSYFDDQRGRVMRGSSFSTSLDTVAPALSLRHSRGLSWMSGLGDGPLSLSEFTELLPQVLARCETKHMRKCEPVKRLLQRLALPKEEWEPFAFWSQDKLYTRNLVATDNKTFTLLLLCWNPGKESPIHDHPCDGCWVKNLQGTVKETVYHMAEGRLVPEQENFFHPGELSYIEDSLGFHKVGNPDAQLGAVTLHCYIPPPRNARVWLASKGTREEDSMMVPTCLYSAFGQRLHEGADGAAPPVGGACIMAPGAGEVVGSPPKAEGFAADKLAA